MHNLELKQKKLFNGLSEGGNVTMPLQDTFWEHISECGKTSLGIQWMVNYDDPDKIQQH